MSSPTGKQKNIKIVTKWKIQSWPSNFCDALSHSMASPEHWGGVVTIVACKWSISNRFRLSARTRHSPLRVISICKEACISHISDHSLTLFVINSHNLSLSRWVTCYVCPYNVSLDPNSQVSFNFGQINTGAMSAGLCWINRLNLWWPYFW